MTNSDHAQTRPETTGTPTRRRGGPAGASFGLRAAVLAGLVAATAGGVISTQGISDDPVAMVSGANSTCCPPSQP